MLFLAIGDPALVVGILGLSGVLHLEMALALVLTAVGVFLNVAAVVEIIRAARHTRHQQGPSETS